MFPFSVGHRDEAEDQSPRLILSYYVSSPLWTVSLDSNGAFGGQVGKKFLTALARYIQQIASGGHKRRRAVLVEEFEERRSRRQPWLPR